MQDCEHRNGQQFDGLSLLFCLGEMLRGGEPSAHIPATYPRYRMAPNQPMAFSRFFASSSKKSDVYM